jgi:hypothetical protein
VWQVINKKVRRNPTNEHTSELKGRTEVITNLHGGSLIVELRKWKLKLSVSEQERNGCTENMFIFRVTEKEVEMVTKI